MSDIETKTEKRAWFGLHCTTCRSEIDWFGFPSDDKPKHRCRDRVIRAFNRVTEGRLPIARKEPVTPVVVRGTPANKPLNLWGKIG